MKWIASLSLILSFSSGCDSYRRIEEDLREKNASVRLKEFHRHAYGADGSPRWVIKADDTYIYQTEDTESLIIAYDFQFQHFQENRSLGTLTADRGEINYETRLITVEGNVRYAGQGQVFSGSSMNYHIDTHVLDSTLPVTILEKGLSTLCRGGVTVDREQEREVCRNPAGVSVGTQSGSIEQLFR